MKLTKYYVYRCTRASETRGTRTSNNPDSKGRQRKEPCGKFGIHRTKKEITDNWRPQAECKICGNKPRLSPTNTKQFEYESDAWRYKDKANRRFTKEVAQ